MSVSPPTDSRTDPGAPREQDRARAVPLDSDALLNLDDAKILAAPADPRDWTDWRAQLHRWRDEARARVAYDGERYERPNLAWTQRCFSVCLAWLWDEQLYDHRRHRFTPEAFLAADAGFGGYDAVVLWHTYPLIGIDGRDQFDLYRDVPGLPDLVAKFHERGVRVFMEYQNWDIGGRTDRDDAAELVALVRATAVDGVFLDTMREAPPDVRAALDATARGIVLEGESNIPLARIADHEMSWAQWQADSQTPGVLRAKWFEQRHMLHQTRRWDRDRTAQLRTAWLNGAGMLVWENVFGSWVGWSPRDRATLTAMLAVQRRFAPHFSHGEWAPLADPADRVAPSVWASRFTSGGTRLWTVAGRDDHPLGPADAILAASRTRDRWFELTTGRELDPVIRGGEARVALPALDRPFGAILAVPSAEFDPLLRDFLAERAAQPRSDDSRSPVRAQHRVTPVQAPLAATPGLLRFPSGARPLTVRYRLRETGMYGDAPFADLWKPLPPLLHRMTEERHEVALDAFATSPLEVTNAEFARFVVTSRYRPAIGERFLADWDDGVPRAGTEREPVRYVDLDDARAYARWAGLRLPTEFEWQVAAGDPRFGRGEPLVWNWTESEHTDGRTRYAILKGGSTVGLIGSEWYTDAGPQPPEVSLKWLRAGPSIERSAAIGFRCAADIATAAPDA
jgi:formylglycine-generating enzyme required for sulfatase activity